MEPGGIVNLLENKAILVTGGTGFLAKIFVEKILRIQPKVKKLYLLIRAADAKSATLRLHNEIIGKDVFRILKEKYGTNIDSFISEKVTPVPGDITLVDFGIEDPNLKEEMWRDIDIVVNAAATTNFDERYDTALLINTLGTKHVFNFTNKCSNLKMCIHVSTAYVSGEREGIILESSYKMGETLNGQSGLDVDSEIKIAEEKLNELQAEKISEAEITLAMKDLGIARAKTYGWPNTYVFTKAMSEMLAGQLKGKTMPLVIIRPTIVTSTYKDPFPGWVEGLRTIDSLSIGYGKGALKCFPGDPESIVDVIPADLVVNSMLVAMAANWDEPCEIIYHVGSSVSHPLTAFKIQNYGRIYFTKKPWINKEGKPVKVGNVRIMSTVTGFRRYIAIRYLLPLKILQLLSLFSKYFEAIYIHYARKMTFVMRLVQVYEPYLFFKGIYDDMNMEKLRMAARESCIEEDMFCIDPKCIDWDSYFLNIHIPGTVKYVFK